eukprot:m.11221 g.11221  ORF g.11221 m.11221 type:complete len:654 (+) comp3798_c0_seq1:15-1976(+)
MLLFSKMEVPVSMLFEVKESDFDVDTYVRSIGAKEELSAGKLRQEKERLQLIQDDMTKRLKETVYKHHARFIDITKDVSRLEGDVTELGHLLHIEASGITEMISSLHAGISEQAQDIGYTIADVNGLDKSEALVAGEILYQGPLELAQLRHNPVDLPVHVFLLKNSLVVAKKEGHGSLASRDPLSLISVESLHSCHVEEEVDDEGAHRGHNVQANEGGTIAITGRDHYLFAAPSQMEKRKWLRRLHRAIGAHFENQSATSIFSHSALAETWLLESPEKLESSIAQRLFSDAVECYTKSNTTILSFDGALDPATAGVQKKLYMLKEKLSDSLCRELDRPALGRSVVRNTVDLLLKLNEADKARAKYLEHWSGTLRREFRNLRVEGSTELFVRKLSIKLFTVFKTTTIEFAELFHDVVSQSAFVTWVNAEMKEFCAIFIRQVFDSKTNSFATVSECVGIVRSRATTVQLVGLDVEFLFWKFVEKNCCDCIQEAGEECTTSVLNALVKDSYDTIVFGGRTAKKEFLATLTQAGVQFPRDLLEGMRAVLFRCSEVFVVELHEFVNSAAQLFNTSTSTDIIYQLHRIFKLFLNQMTRKFDGQQKFIDNVNFALDIVLVNSIKPFETANGGRVEELHTLSKDLLAQWTKARNEDGISHL